MHCKKILQASIFAVNALAYMCIYFICLHASVFDANEFPFLLSFKNSQPTF